jgi:hypothetical protein
MTSSEQTIRAQLKIAEAAVVQAQLVVDDSTEYLEDDLFELRRRLLELREKLDRDAVLQRDREAFAEPSAGLKEWLSGGPRQR